MSSIAASRFSPYRSTETVLGSNPAANAEVSVTVPAGELWLVRAVTVALVQGITQTPLPVLRITDGTNVFFESPGSTTAQAVSTTCQYTWAPGMTLTGQIGATTGVHSVAPLLEGILLIPGSVISTVTVGLGANSDYGVPAVRVLKGAG